MSNKRHCHLHYEHITLQTNIYLCKLCRKMIEVVNSCQDGVLTVCLSPLQLHRPFMASPVVVSVSVYLTKNQTLHNSGLYAVTSCRYVFAMILAYNGLCHTLEVDIKVSVMIVITLTFFQSPRCYLRIHPWPLPFHHVYE